MEYREQWVWNHRLSPRHASNVSWGEGTIFDPIVFAGPFILFAKQILYEACKFQLQWKNVLPKELNKWWHQWKEEALNIGKFKFWLITEKDASNLCNCPVSYLREVNTSLEYYDLNFLCGKSSVRPFSKITISWLELMTVKESVKLLHYYRTLWTAQSTTLTIGLTLTHFSTTFTTQIYVFFVEHISWHYWQDLTRF